MKARYFENTSGNVVIEHDKGSVRVTLGGGDHDQVVLLNQRNAILIGEAIADAGRLLPAPPVTATT